MRRVVRYPEHKYLLIDALPTPQVIFIIADNYPAEIYSLNVECVKYFPMNNLRTHKCVGVDACNNYDHMPEAT